MLQRQEPFSALPSESSIATPTSLSNTPGQLCPADKDQIFAEMIEFVCRVTCTRPTS